MVCEEELTRELSLQHDPKSTYPWRRILYRIEISIMEIQSLAQKQKQKSIVGSIFNPPNVEATQKLLMEEFDGMASSMKSAFDRIVGFFFIKYFLS
jgi:hypothetical protein